MPAIAHILGWFSLAAVVSMAGATRLHHIDPPEDPPGEAGDTDEANADALPQRVVLRLGRTDMVAGVIEREDADLMVIRTPEGEVKAYPKSRITHTTRLVDPEPGQRGRVILWDDTRREGIIVEDTYQWVIVQIEGIRTRLDRSVVRGVELMPTDRELYEQYRKNIRPDMHVQRFELAQWLVERQMYAEAEAELSALYADKPDLPKVYDLLRLVRAQLVLESQNQEGAGATGNGTTQGTQGSERTGPVDQRDILPKRILTDDEVNIIRVYEIDFDRPPKVRVPVETIRALIENHASHEAMPVGLVERNALFRADPIEVVRLIFAVKARELYGEIEVLSEPYALNLFRQRVHNTWLIHNCATSRCHGGVEAGRFFLHNRHHEDTRVRYTNFLILERLEIDPARPLINYQEPTNSKIIQHGLPRAEARDPHPDVPGWKPAFNPGNTRLIEDTVRWIEAMYPNRPKYPVDYSPPVLGRAADPADRDRSDR